MIIAMVNLTCTPPIRYKHNRFQQLRGFCAVVELRSMSKAAARLHLTQPTVSLQVQALERELSTQLFERRGPKIQITPDGESLYELARPLLEGLSGIDGDFEARRNNVERGRLSIAAGESTIQYVLPTTVQKFATTHPGISLALNNVTGVDGLQQLRERRVDFCVGPLLDISPDLEFEPIVGFDPVLITSLGHALAKQRSVTVKQISKYPLILPPRHLSTWRQVELVFLQNRLPYEVRLEMGGWEVIKRYVELGLGISIVMSVCLDSRDKLRVIPVQKYFPRRVYGIVRLKDRPLSPQARHFIDIFRSSSGHI
jgi:DNA-binding transcriptional LysR family regulator